MKLKHILGVLAFSGLAFSLSACGDDANNNENANTSTGESQNNNTGDNENTPTTPTVDQSKLAETKLYCVGDSTMCNYATLDSYYYPRYGYATQLSKYFCDKVTVENLALSGRSSVSFLSEANYTTMKNSIKSGDYLLIGWGHNDEKAGTATFRNAKYDSIDLAMADTNSFQYSIYYNYIKVAQDAGAYPILATPIVRASSSNDYSSDKGHVTSTGDYREAIIDVATKYDIPVVDLTTITKDTYKALGYSEAIKFHAIKQGTDESEGQDPKWTSVDETHINFYGANYVSYEFANALKNTNSALKDYVKADITKPTETILTKYDGYKWSAYAAPVLTGYNDTITANLKCTSDGWYGTAFGSLGGDPKVSGNGYYAQETSTGVFKVGQGQSTGSTPYKGKLASTEDGEAFAFMQIPSNQNFTLSADAVVLSYDGDNKQGGFGITLKDACWLNNNDKTLLTNYVTAGVLVDSATSSTINFSRDASGLVKSGKSHPTGITAGMKASFELKREGQTVYITTKVYTSATEYTEYSISYKDFDFVAKDANYMYVGMFGARGTIAEFSNVVYTPQGTAQDA